MKRVYRVVIILFVLCSVVILTSQFVTAQTKLDVNKATVDQLVKFGVPETVAKALVDYRDKNGPFKKPEDLLKVKGVSKDLLNKLKPKAEGGAIYITPLEEEDDEPSLKPSKC